MSREKRVDVAEKQRIRVEIAHHIETFLRNGGKIETLNRDLPRIPNSIGSIWHDHRELSDFIGEE